MESGRLTGLQRMHLHSAINGEVALVCFHAYANAGSGLQDKISILIKT